MFELPRTIPLPGEPCPPAGDVKALLLWIKQQHRHSGRFERHQRQSEQRLADEIASDEDLTGRIVQLAVLFDVQIDGLSHAEQIAAVVRACMPLHLLIGAELEGLRQRARAAEVLGSVY